MDEEINIDWAASWASANELANKYRDALIEVRNSKLLTLAHMAAMRALGEKWHHGAENDSQADGEVNEKWKRELVAAGWKAIRSTIWESPNRLLYRGPYLAWCVMKGVPCVPCELPSSNNTEGKQP
jgi:hypothetical protein